MDEDYAPVWSQNGNYGTVVYNTDGSVGFSTRPWEDATDEDGNSLGYVKPGAVYNNGCGWSLMQEESAVDVSGSRYLVIKMKCADYSKMKLMTWSGAASPSSYWGKYDTWGQWTDVVDNQDGTISCVYNVSSVFRNAKKAKGVGITLKSWDGVDETDEHFKEEQAKIYSIVFTNKLPTALTNPLETYTIQISDVETSMSDVGVECVVDDDGEPCCQVLFTKNYHRIFYELPEEIDLAD